MFESVPTKVIAPTGVVAAPAIVAAKKRAHALAARTRSHAHTIRIADVVIEPLQLRVQGRQGKNVFCKIKNSLYRIRNDVLRVLT